MHLVVKQRRVVSNDVNTTSHATCNAYRSLTHVKRPPLQVERESHMPGTKSGVAGGTAPVEQGVWGSGGSDARFPGYGQLAQNAMMQQWVGAAMPGAMPGQGAAAGAGGQVGMDAACAFGGGKKGSSSRSCVARRRLTKNIL